MAFEHKPGSFSLFKNEKKSDKAPDYRGDGMDLDGNVIEVAAWLKEGKNGKFMSCTIKVKGDVKQKAAPIETLDDDVPF